MIKFLWGGLVDYFRNYGKRFFVITGGIVSALFLILVINIDPSTNLILFIIFLIFCSLGLGILDVAADAWAIEITITKEHGKISGAMLAGQSMGYSFSAFLIPMFSQNLGYSNSFLIFGSILLFFLIFPLISKEKIVIRKNIKIISKLFNEFKNKSIFPIAIFLPISMISVGIITIFMPIYSKTELDLDLIRIGYIMGFSPIIFVIGTILGGIITDKYGRKISIYFFMNISGLFIFSIIFINNWENIAIVYWIISFLHGGYQPSIMAIAMDITNPEISATEFSIYASLLNLGEMGSTAMAGTLIVFFGFTKVILFSVWFIGIALFILYFINEKVKIQINKSN